jgi:hypothetical protein
MTDKRKPFTHLGCIITPEIGKHRYFGVIPGKPDQSRWWRVMFPDTTWCLCATIPASLGYIHQVGASHGIPMQTLHPEAYRLA